MIWLIFPLTWNPMVKSQSNLLCWWNDTFRSCLRKKVTSNLWCRNFITMVEIRSSAEFEHFQDWTISKTHHYIISKTTMWITTKFAKLMSNLLFYFSPKTPVGLAKHVLIEIFKEYNILSTVVSRSFCVNVFSHFIALHRILRDLIIMFWN